MKENDKNGNERKYSKKPRPPLKRHIDPRDGKKRPDAEETEAGADGIIEGRNAVLEALKAGKPLNKLYLASGDTDAILGFIARTAREAGVTVTYSDRRRLDLMSATGAHQGVIAHTAVREYSTVERIFELAAERNEKPLIVVCDEITDPHNLGAIIRTAEAAGAHGIIIPKRRSAGLTAVTEKASAGALSHMPVARVPNISMALLELKKRGLWIFGAAADGKSSLYTTDFAGASAIVIGSEGDGIGQLVSKNCDYLVSIPMNGKISSLNASAAAAILLYEVVRQRMRIKQG